MAKPGKAWKSIEVADERRLTAGLVHHRWPCWSSDGKWLAFAADDAWVIADRRGRVARVFEGPADGGGAFGKASAFAFGLRAGTTSEIWMSSGGGAPAVRLLGGDGGRYREPAFSPDGQRVVVAWSADGSTRTRLLSLELSTGARQPLTHDAARSDARPAFSPDGSLLFFEGAVHDDVSLLVIDVQSGELTRAGNGWRRPAPLSNELVVVERDGKLALLEWRSGRERPLFDAANQDRDPAVVRGKSKVRLAWSRLPPGDGKPRRADIFSGRVYGLDALAQKPREPAPAPELTTPPVTF